MLNFLADTIGMMLDPIPVAAAIVIGLAAQRFPTRIVAVLVVSLLLALLASSVFGPKSSLFGLRVYLIYICGLTIVSEATRWIYDQIRTAGADQPSP